MLHSLKPAHGSRSRAGKKRVGRGNGSGTGTTAGRGTKGQQARTGKGRKFGFEGGQVPLLRRQPKIGGFKRSRRVNHEAVTLEMLEEKLEAGSYDMAALRKMHIVRGGGPVKLLGSAVTKAFKLSVHASSRAAKQAVEKAGGSVTIVKA
jgi:large subunit ribosomal protein L15